MPSGEHHDRKAPRRIAPLRVQAFTATSALGRGNGATLRALRTRTSGLSHNDFGGQPVDTYIGRVAGIEDEPLPEALQHWDSRNNRLAWLALKQDGFADALDAARQRYDANRIALVLGTSTACIGATEEAYRNLDVQGCFPQHLRNPLMHAPHSTCNFLSHALGLESLCVTVATACSSSAKVFAEGERFIRSGLADAVLVGGVDSLCDSVLFGFNSLDLVSPDLCRPFDIDRNGINLGEAAGFALLTRDGSGPGLVGYGESSDAFHMSSPRPDGMGARTAIADALARAGVSADSVDYVNLHGTASRKNDEVEAQTISSIFPARTLASSTKGWTGHTLGAAGILEAIITLLAMQDSMAPGTLNTTQIDPACASQVRIDNTDTALDTAMSLSFGFGGSNCALVFGNNA
ncbi:MAG: beta-ketoacyl-[acyl-carrier-protein] synthase family protein [Burkholderiales bacterium]|jgi:3-oxoacyl-[acyl-carrier-protein] synthase-1